MGELFKWPSVTDSLSKEKIHDKVIEKIYFEFADGQKRREALEVINKLRETSPDIFVGLQSIEPDSKWERQYQGLEFAFSTIMDGRDQKILELLHEKNIWLNIKDDGTEEKPYVLGPKDIEERAA
jgi:hypothetical protein